MGALNKICKDTETTLRKVEDECKSIITSLAEFEKYISSYAAERLSRRLAILGAWVSLQADSRQKEHKGQGYVCIFLTEREGITVHWVEKEEIVADKSYFEASGIKVLSVSEVDNLIGEKYNQVLSGNWVPEVDWLKKYGKSPGLDFEKILLKWDDKLAIVEKK